MAEKRYRVAILTGQTRGNEYGDDDFIAQSITDWVEVSEEERNLLLRAQRDYRLTSKIGSFVIIEQPVDPKTWVFKTIEEFMAILKREEEERLLIKAEQERKRQEQVARRKMSREAKERERIEKAIRENPDLAKEIISKVVDAPEEK
jgi:hypothetical protein